jgi:hypothetical protein
MKVFYRNEKAVTNQVTAFLLLLFVQLINIMLIVNYLISCEW